MGSDRLPRIRFVLVRPSHPGNIGAAARALKNMGFYNLDLVAPRLFPAPEATAMASGALDVLESVRVFPDLPDALAHADCILGFSARSRSVSLDVYDARTAAAYVYRGVPGSPDPGLGPRFSEVALVFGSERTGLENHELAQCSAHVYIPTSAYRALNLAMAVQIMAYELHLIQMGWETALEHPAEGAAEPAPGTPAPADHPATHQEIEGFFQHLHETLTAIGFLRPTTQKLMYRLRRLYHKAKLERREVHILRGILTTTMRAIGRVQSTNRN